MIRLWDLPTWVLLPACLLMALVLILGGLAVLNLAGIPIEDQFIRDGQVCLRESTIWGETIREVCR